MSVVASYHINSRQELEGRWPNEIAALPSLDILDGVWFEPPRHELTDAEYLTSSLVFENEIALNIPGLDGFSIVFAPNGEGGSAFPLSLEVSPRQALSVGPLPMALRFQTGFLRPAERVTDANGATSIVPTPGTVPLQLQLAGAIFETDFDGNCDIRVDATAGLALPLCLIGDTGIAIEAQNVQLRLRPDPDNPLPDKPANWRGLYLDHVAVYLPGTLAGISGITMSHAYIGNGGFSGTVTISWPNAGQPEAAWGGLRLKPTSVGLTFAQNSLTEASILGAMRLPFFDEWIDVALMPSLNGDMLVRVARSDGLFNLHKDGVLDFTVESLGFALRDGQAMALLSGKLTPLFGAPGLTWPSFQIKELAIGADGSVRLDGGWLNLPEHYRLDFYGFSMEITKLGMGKNQDGSQWVGFSGGLKLADGISAGASVEGLRITWGGGGGPRLSFAGIGVEFEAPGALRFKGAIAYRSDANRFDGAIQVQLLALGIELDGQLVVGGGDQPYFAVYLGAELPAGIPLGATGLGIYGFAGLFAQHMKPGKTDEQQWYDWYQAAPAGVAQLSKWAGAPGHFALGGGVTIGTVADNGFAFSGKMLLAILFPGPVLLIEGKANILTERARLN
ncbi:MAG TPA: hypothetical protein VD886_26610, partial [Herpetosiphonaceae bacterium]|nr:hypothetical protein [Herpetosiphonaceae bacterium]